MALFFYHESNRYKQNVALFEQKLDAGLQMTELDETLARWSVAFCPLSNTAYDERKQTKPMSQANGNMQQTICKLMMCSLTLIGKVAH